MEKMCCKRTFPVLTTHTIWKPSPKQSGNGKYQHTAYIKKYLIVVWCENQSYALSFNHCAQEIHKTNKMPLTCKSLTQGLILPEMLEPAVHVR